MTFFNDRMSTTRLHIYVLIVFLLSLVNLARANHDVASEPGPNSVVNFYKSDATVSFDREPIAQTDVPEFKNKTRARLYSVAFTTIPLALARLNARGYDVSDQTGTSILLITPAILMGPSAGSIYSDDWILAKRSIIIRSVSATVLITGYNLRKAENFEALGFSLLISGGLLLISHSLYDIFYLSAHSVEFYNAKLRMETGMSLNNMLPQEWGDMTNLAFHQEIRPIPSIDIRLFF